MKPERMLLIALLLPLGAVQAAEKLPSLPEPRVVQEAKGYNSWPMIQALGEKLVCVYSRGSGHTIGEDARAVYARTSTDGGKTWTPETVVANTPGYGDVEVGKGLDANGAMLLWVRRIGKDSKHDLYRTTDGVQFTLVATPKLAVTPIQITDVFAVPTVGLMALWFAGNYGDNGPCHSWGTLISSDNGATWKQTPIESGLPKAQWPTEPAAVYLGEGKLLAIGRTETGSPQFQMVSTDYGKTWTRQPTNIGDVHASTPSLILDTETGLLSNYYYERGKAGLLHRRVVAPDRVFSQPLNWPASEPVAAGSQITFDAGNANATASKGTHYVAFYSGQAPDTAVLVAVLPAPKPTRAGPPVQHMWAAPRANPKLEACGFPKVQNVRTAAVYRPQKAAEQYNHCAELIWHGGRFHAMWINHPEGEDLPGQRILYASSPDGVAWSAAAELFPPPGEVKVKTPGERRNPTGPRTKTYAFSIVDERLYAIAGVFDNWRLDAVPAAREVRADGSFGPFFAVAGKVKVPTLYPILPADDVSVAAVAQRLATFLAAPFNRAPMYHAWYLGQAPSTDGNVMWEPVTYRAGDGRLVQLARGRDITHRMYVSTSGDDGRTFPRFEPTDIPDSPSLARALRLDDRTLLLIGHQVATVFDPPKDKAHHDARDPLTVSFSADGYCFDRVVALRWGSPKPRFRGDGGLGFQYPSAIIHDGRLCVLYTVCKEDVEFAAVELAELRRAAEAK